MLDHVKRFPTLTASPSLWKSEIRDAGSCFRFRCGLVHRVRPRELRQGHRLHSLMQEWLCSANRYGKIGILSFKMNECRDSNNFTTHVQQRSTTTTMRDWRGCLDIGWSSFRRPPQRTNDSIRHGIFEFLRITDGNDRLSNFDSVGLGEPQR